MSEWKLTLPNLMVFFAFLSPIVITISVVSMSIIFQNFKGFIYLGFLIAAVLVRVLLEKTNLYSDESVIANSNDICNKIKFSTKGNNTYSLFLATFTFVYLCLPMFINSTMNWAMFASFIFYIITATNLNI